MTYNSINYSSFSTFFSFVKLNEVIFSNFLSIEPTKASFNLKTERENKKGKIDEDDKTKNKQEKQLFFLVYFDQLINFGSYESETYMYFTAGKKKFYIKFWS